MEKITETYSVKSLDHIVLTVKNIEESASFYQKALGMEIVYFGANNDRIGLLFGTTKINLHQAGKEFDPKAAKPTPGSADICFITDTPIQNFIEHLKQLKIFTELGPIERTGAIGKILSIYFRDLDSNLIEVANYL